MGKLHLYIKKVESDLFSIAVGLPAVLFGFGCLLNPGVANFSRRGLTFKYTAPQANKIDEDASPATVKTRYCYVCSIWQKKGVTHCPTANICVNGYWGYSTMLDKPLGKYNIGLAIACIVLLVVSLLSQLALNAIEVSA